MSDFKIAAAQVPSVRGDIEGNIAGHAAVVEPGASEHISAIVFPELSLIGDERDLAAARMNPMIAATIDFTKGPSRFVITEVDMKLELAAVFRKVPEGYIGVVEELPGAKTQGTRLEEARKNLPEAARLVPDANRELAQQENAGLPRDGPIVGSEPVMRSSISQSLFKLSQSPIRLPSESLK